jgi:hypothetical protein
MALLTGWCLAGAAWWRTAVLGLLADRCFKAFLASQAEEDAQNRKSCRRITLKANQLSTVDGIGDTVGIDNQLGLHLVRVGAGRPSVPPDLVGPAELPPKRDAMA